MLRRYTRADYTDCLQILDSNIPRFFSMQDRINFLSFLDAPVGTYSVLEDIPHHIIGCGGISLRNNNTTGILTWGMIHSHYHHQRWGSLLTIERLLQLNTIPSIKKITLSTSHETVGFYKKIGFQSTNFIPDFYGTGLHRYDMEIAVDEHYTQRILLLKTRYIIREDPTP